MDIDARTAFDVGKTLRYSKIGGETMKEIFDLLAPAPQIMDCI
jgi:hypothetical protein